MSFLKKFINSFIEKRLLLKAAALSYTSVLTLLPLVAITFTITNYAISQADPSQINQILDFFLNRMIPQVELLDKPLSPETGGHILTKQEIKNSIKTIISQLGSGQIGIVGGSTFLFLACSLLLTIEDSLNDIWNVSYGRNLSTRIVLYLAILVLGSLFILLSVIFTTQYQGSKLLKTLQHIPLLPRILQFLLPFVLNSVVLCLIYLVLPNSGVNFWAGIIGGTAAGTLLQLNTMLSFIYLLNVTTAARLYGKLGILPIFLAGLYVSWLIVLSGAQFTRHLELRFDNTNPD